MMSEYSLGWECYKRGIDVNPFIDFYSQLEWKRGYAASKISKTSQDIRKDVCKVTEPYKGEN